METLADTFQSLAAGVRLRILALLLEEEELCVCDLITALQLPQSTVSRHLAHLKSAGWLRDRREGGWSYYALAAPLGPVQQSLRPLLSHFLRNTTEAAASRARLKASATCSCD